ncbi:MAG: SLBB domain-containing protein [Planctomycetes bacterium]|nr:SLBB domain-containing protein [Planctomycetota bacterium]
MRLAALLIPLLVAASCAVYPDSSELEPQPVVDLTRGQIYESAELSSLLDALEPDPNAIYRIGPGDVLALEVWGYPNLSGKQTVGPDGRISVAGLGTLRVDGMAREEAEAAIEEMLRRAYENVAVALSVEIYASNRVSVLGGVNSPGSYNFERVPSLLEALARAGGLAELGPGVVPTRCSILRGRDQIVWIDLRELLWHGNASLNVRLRADDTIWVQDSSDVVVYVLGEVRTAGLFRLTPGMTVSDALALAGGTTRDSDASAMRLLRRSGDSRGEIDFDELNSETLTYDVQLRDGDILLVPVRALAAWSYFWRNVNPFSGFFSGGA